MIVLLLSLGNGKIVQCNYSNSRKRVLLPTFFHGCGGTSEATIGVQYGSMFKTLQTVLDPFLVVVTILGQQIAHLAISWRYLTPWCLMYLV